MSKNKNYGSFYSKKEPEQETVEVSYDNKTEEITTTEETVEAPVEEEKKEEPKVEDVRRVNELYAIVTGAKKVYMRFKPNKSGQPINVLPENAKVKIVESTNEEWWKVSYKGMTGYMMSKFLKEV